MQRKVSEVLFGVCVCVRFLLPVAALPRRPQNGGWWGRRCPSRRCFSPTPCGPCCPTPQAYLRAPRVFGYFFDNGFFKGRKKVRILSFKIFLRGLFALFCIKCFGDFFSPQKRVLEVSLLVVSPLAHREAAFQLVELIPPVPASRVVQHLLALAETREPATGRQQVVLFPFT